MEKEEKKEEKKKINLGKISVCIIMTIAICISVIIIRPVFTNDKEKYKNELDEVVEELNTLQAKKIEIFTNQGFTKEYYDTDSKISSLTQKKLDLEKKTKNGYIAYNIIGSLFSLFFGGVFSAIAYNIFNRKKIMENHYEHLEKIAKAFGEGYAEATGSPKYVPLKCPQCGANLKGEKIEKCPYCDTVLEKVRKK